MSDLSPGDEELLERALQLAERGATSARPNPVVGAVIADRDGRVLAEGWHERRGGRHAERVALDALTGPLPEGAAMYVSLEPCAHQGLQPPCVEAVIGAGLSRVVIACPDSDPRTAGIGAASLREAGVEVAWAPEDIADRAATQNAGFHWVKRHGRPYVTYKWAMTPSGALATGDPEDPWISGPESRELVHQWRAASGAILIGIGTALADDPQLTVRGDAAESMASPPIRVVVDRGLRLPPDSRLVSTADEAPVLVATGPDAPADRAGVLEAAGVEIWRPNAELLLDLLSELARRGVLDVLAEPGPRLATALWEADLMDRLACFTGPRDPAPGGTQLPSFPATHPLRRALEHAAPEPVGEDTLRIQVVHPVCAWVDGAPA